MSNTAYTPTPPGDRITVTWLMEELRRIQAALALLGTVQVPELHAPPAKPLPQQIVFADGTDWNPGSGRGFYGYDSGTWRFLG